MLLLLLDICSSDIWRVAVRSFTSLLWRVGYKWEMMPEFCCHGVSFSIRALQHILLMSGCSLLLLLRDTLFLFLLDQTSSCLAL